MLTPDSGHWDGWRQTYEIWNWVYLIVDEGGPFNLDEMQLQVSVGDVIKPCHNFEEVLLGHRGVTLLKRQKAGIVKTRRVMAPKDTIEEEPQKSKAIARIAGAIKICGDGLFLS